ncbi:MAG: MazG nucleotide pyrophosphohydrolase domain-containing protein [Sumerlaeia bacterium]
MSPDSAPQYKPIDPARMEVDKVAPECALSPQDRQAVASVIGRTTDIVVLSTRIIDCRDFIVLAALDAGATLAISSSDGDSRLVFGMDAERDAFVRLATEEALYLLQDGKAGEIESEADNAYGYGLYQITPHGREIHASLAGRLYLHGGATEQTTDVAEVIDKAALAIGSITYLGGASATAIDLPEDATPAQAIEAMLHRGFGLAEEAGETAGVLKRLLRGDYLRDGEIDRHALADALEKELGDVAWYWVMLASIAGLDPASVLYANLTKLAGRASRGTLRGKGDER